MLPDLLEELTIHSQRAETEQKRRDAFAALAAAYRCLDAIFNKLLLSDPEHAIPRPARGYLIAEEQVDDTAAAYTGWQPVVDVPDHDFHDAAPGDHEHDGDEAYGEGNHAQSSRAGLDNATSEGGDAGDARETEGRHATDPRTILWRLLTEAPPEGVGIAEMLAETRMGRSWLHLRLREHHDAGRVALVARGRYRALTDPGPNPGPTDTT